MILSGWSYADFLAEEEARGAAVRVPDGAMEPILFEDDAVGVERREAMEDDLICMQVDGRTANTLHRLQGPDLALAGNEHVVGVATAVIDRDLRQRRR